MEKRMNYQNAILSMLRGHEFQKQNIQSFLLADKEKFHYQLFMMGTKNDGSTFIGLRIYLYLTDTGKIWILENKTEHEIGEELVLLGVHPQDIVVGFLPEQARQYSGYGTK